MDKLDELITYLETVKDGLQSVANPQIKGYVMGLDDAIAKAKELRDEK